MANVRYLEHQNKKARQLERAEHRNFKHHLSAFGVIDEKVENETNHILAELQKLSVPTK